MSKLKGMMFGALAGTFIASAFALLGSRQTLIKKFRSQTQGLAERARNVKENFEDIYGLMESKRSRNRKTFARGTVLGLLIGAGTAALLTPKSGKQLRRDLTHKYHGVADKTQDVIHFINQNGYRKPFRKLSKVIAKRRHRTRV